MTETSGQPARVGLVGCVKSKRASEARAADLYTSPLFKGRRRWVEARCNRWFILSAKYGLTDPDEVIEPYDLTLNSVPRSECRSWSRDVLADLSNRLGDLTGLVFEIHAGSRYADFGLADGLREAGALVALPVAHLGIGQQLALYAANS